MARYKIQIDFEFWSREVLVYGPHSRWPPNIINSKNYNGVHRTSQKIFNFETFLEKCNKMRITFQETIATVSSLTFKFSAT
jgi:hypothetical protein